MVNKDKWYYLGIVLLGFFLLPLGVYAQDEAMMTVSSAYKAMKGICTSMAVICAIIGSIQVYKKISMGDSEAVQSILSWWLGVIFVLLIPSLIDLLFR